MNLDEVVDELFQRIENKQTPDVVKKWLESIGFVPTPEEGEPGYTEAAVTSMARSLGAFYSALRKENVPDHAAKEITIAYINVTFGKS